MKGQPSLATRRCKTSEIHVKNLPFHTKPKPKQKRMINLTNQQNETTNDVAIIENSGLVIQSETKDYTIYKDEVTGKFVRKAKYDDYSSIEATTREEKIWLLNLLEGAEDTGHGLKDSVGKTIEVANVIIRKYDRINEDTGFQENGVLTYLLTPDKVAYVTSSKNVYFSITRIMSLFGKPNEAGWENVKVLVQKEKATNGDMIKIKLVG